MRTTTTKLLALGTAAALGLAACGGSDEETNVAISGEARPVQQETEAPEAEPTTAGPEIPATVDDAASTLRADLTLLLQEHVHLTGMAVAGIAADGEDGPLAQGAVRALDENAAALGEVVGALPGVDDPAALVDAWREHVAAYVGYATARVEEDDAGAEAAMASLEELLQPLAGLFEQISDEELVADELFGELETHVTMVTEAIDAMVAEDAEASDLLHDAALHMDVVAADLAAGLVAAHPEELPGDPLSVPAETRASLTSALVEHTYLSVLTGVAAAGDDGTGSGPAVQAAVTTLEGGADSLANTLSGAAGNDGRQAFLDLWRPFLTAVSDYASATVAGDTAAAGEARATMDAAPAALADLLQGSTEGDAPGDLAGLLSTHVDNLAGAIDAIAADDPAAATQARAAAQHASVIASGLAAAMVVDEPAAGGSADEGATDGEDAEGLNADADTAAPDQSADSSSDAGSVGTTDAGASTDDAGPGAEASSDGDVDSQG